jgi:hypothetical protein
MESRTKKILIVDLINQTLFQRTMFVRIWEPNGVSRGSLNAVFKDFYKMLNERIMLTIIA